MARVKKRKANKDYPDHGIKKGDTYYTWQLYRQRPRKQLTYPRRSQLTGSSFLQTIYDIVDVELVQAQERSDFESIAESIRAAGEECESSRSNMPDHLQDADSGTLLQARVDSCSEWADAVDTAVNTFTSSLEEIEGDDELSEDEKAEKIDEARDACRDEIEGAEPDWE